MRLSDSRAIEYLNKKISERTRYGKIKAVTKSPGYILSWSNADKCWDVMQHYPKGTSIILDANQIFAPFPKKQLYRIKDKLITLPLFKFAFETAPVSESCPRGLPEEKRPRIQRILSALKRYRANELTFEEFKQELPKRAKYTDLELAWKLLQEEEATDDPVSELIDIGFDERTAELIVNEIEDQIGDGVMDIIEKFRQKKTKKITKDDRRRKRKKRRNR